MDEGIPDQCNKRGLSNEDEPDLHTNKNDTVAYMIKQAQQAPNRDPNDTMARDEN